MPSQTDICNLALSAIGARSTIADINEGSAEANACLVHYDNVLEMALRSAHWNFARRQVALTLLKDATAGDTVPGPWVYSYAYPSDCVRARFVVPTYQTSPNAPSAVLPQPYYVGQPVRFIVSTDLDADGNPVQVILTNQPQAELVYTWRCTLTSFFDGDFVAAFARLLGVAVCIPVSGDKALRKLALDEARVILDEAQTRNGNEGLTVQEDIPDWIRARGYASDWAFPDGGYLYYGPQALELVI